MRFKLIITIMIIVIGYFQYRIWIGDGSYEEVYQLQKKIEKQKLENASLKERNQRLYAEVVDLKNGLAAVEERARTELGMVKQGETFYQIIGEEKD